MVRAVCTNCRYFTFDSKLLSNRNSIHEAIILVVRRGTTTNHKYPFHGTAEGHKNKNIAYKDIDRGQGPALSGRVTG